MSSITSGDMELPATKRWPPAAPLVAATEWIQERVAELTPEETEQRATTPNLVGGPRATSRAPRSSNPSADGPEWVPLATASSRRALSARVTAASIGRRSPPLRLGGDDPILHARPGAYSVSVARRTAAAD